MHRFIPFTLAFAIIVAALLVFVIQPRQTNMHKRQLKDMRQFLLAQTGLTCPGPGGWQYWWEASGKGSCSAIQGQCDAAYGGDNPNCQQCVIDCKKIRESESGSSNSSNNQGPLTPPQELECFKPLLYESSFSSVWKQYGLPNADPTNMQLKVKEICVYLQNATGNRGGVENIALNAATKKIKDSIYTFLRDIPGPDEKQSFVFETYIKETAYPYIKEGNAIIKEFANLTFTNPYLLSISLNIPPYYSPYIEKLANDLTHLLPKPAEKIAEVPRVIAEPAIIQPLPAITTPALQQTPVQTPITTRALLFIKRMETIFSIRGKGLQRKATSLNPQKWKGSVEKIMDYYHFLLSSRRY